MDRRAKTRLKKNQKSERITDRQEVWRGLMSPLMVAGQWSLVWSYDDEVKQ